MISVALCTFNGEKYIKAQINSILNQTSPVDQIIICDDCSEDNTVPIIKEYIKHGHDNIQLYVNGDNLGVNKNFESALRKCDGDIIFLSDQDDIWEAYKVEHIINYFKNHEKCGLVFTDATLVDANNKVIGDSLWRKIKFDSSQTICFDDFLHGRFVTGATVAIRSKLLIQLLPIPQFWIHDAWLSVNAFILSDIYALNEKTIRYRQHENNVIGVERLSLIQKIRYRLCNIEESATFRKVMYERFKSLYKERKTEISVDDRKNLIKCIKFWKELYEIQNIKKFKGIICILRNYIVGNYKKFNNGYKGMIVDLYICVKHIH